MHMVSALLYSFLVIIMFHSALLGTYLMSCRNSRSLILLFSILRFLITIIIVFSAHKYFIDFFKKMWHVTYQNNP